MLVVASSFALCLLGVRGLFFAISKAYSLLLGVLLGR